MDLQIKVVPEMGLFTKLRGPVFLKEDSEAERHLKELQLIQRTASGELKKEIDQDIRLVELGIYGEKQIRFELENSHIPMYVLHDLYLEHNGLSAQIDYLIVTKRHVFVVECKNLYGNIEITRNGDFVRTVNFGRYNKKEGIYSPVTQNQRHMELGKAIRGEAKKNLITRSLFERDFLRNYRSIVVLANSKTVLNDRYAPKEIRQQVIRVDRLADYIRKTDAEPGSESGFDKATLEIAQFFLEQNKQNAVDYTARYQNQMKMALSEEPYEEAKEILCPRCGAVMVLRKAGKGPNAGKPFYGCSKYPACRGIVNIQRQTE